MTVPALALVAAGQSLGNFASYARGSLSVAVGYGSAMSLSTGRTAEDWYAVVDLVLVVAVFRVSTAGAAGAGNGCRLRSARRLGVGGFERGLRPARHP